ncbi:MAG: hypothetical protein PF484_01660 [Bacteroidales bacterium]|jgi:photosystem II stability/assembly factor-like uncharacterized protein|nr:hypothetical protein [Bacteroidales bacterium]
MQDFLLINTRKTILSFAIILTLFNLSLFAQNQAESPLMQSYKVHMELKLSTNYGLEWIQLGPTLNGARAETVESDPNKPGTLYVAFGSGGLWKSINNGMSWKPIFENMPSLGIGDIALAPSNSEIIYVGTGESLKKARNFTMPGTGIYRSDDGGDSWNHLGLNDCWHIGEISAHPENPDIVLVAVQGHFWSSNTNRGIFRTEDGGKTWEHVLYLDKETGANDIVFSPKDPDIAYASMWQNYPSVNGLKSAIYTSNDAGKTWNKAVNGITINEGTGRIGIAASYQDKNKAYAFIDQRNRDLKDGAGEIYKTLDGGKSWKRSHEDNIYSLAGLGWYFMDIYVNPKNDEEVYALGVGFIHSTDGGKSFDFIRGQINHISPSPAQTMHLDHCELWINPLNPQELLLANDGGAYHSFDNGKTWLHLNNIPTGEFYDVELDNKEPYTIYGGVQDDATVFGPAKEFNPKFNDQWEYLWIDAWSGGDGCITLVDPKDENTVYFSMQNGGARRLDIEKGKSKSIRPRFDEEDISIHYNFLTPYMLSPHNSDRIYMAGNYVMKSDNRGDDWSIISPDLVKLKNNLKKETGAGAMAESFFEEGVLYVGTDRGAVWRTKNGGKDWDDISNGLPENYIRCLYPSKHKKGRIYLQQTGLNYDDFGAYLYVSDNYGKEWKSIKNNLPNQLVNCILEDPIYENILYAGTYRGVYVSENFGRDWSYFGMNLPDASIADIVIDEKSMDMVIATHGRGIYKLNLCPFYTKINSDIHDNFLFNTPNAVFPQRRDTHRDIDENTVEKVPITFWLEESENVELIVTNQNDSVLWSHSLEGQKGFNQYRWDLITKVEKNDQAYFYQFKKYLPIGDYKLLLKSSAWELEKEFTVADFKFNNCGKLADAILNDSIFITPVKTKN